MNRLRGPASLRVKPVVQHLIDVAEYLLGEGLPVPAYSSLLGNELSEALKDNCRTPPDEPAAFRLDWPCWLTTRTERDRRLIRDLMAGERNLDVAREYGLSPARV